MINLIERVKNNDFTLGVVGIGRVGLPMAFGYREAIDWLRERM